MVDHPNLTEDDLEKVDDLKDKYLNLSRKTPRPGSSEVYPSAFGGSKDPTKNANEEEGSGDLEKGSVGIELMKLKLI